MIIDHCMAKREWNVEERKQRGSLVGPVILIGLGVVFLLNNLGVLAWSVWEVILRIR